MRIGILDNISKEKTQETLQEVCTCLCQGGHETVNFASPSEIDGVEAIIVLGGDGAILRAAVVAAQKDILIIGINYGTLGFLAEYEKSERHRVGEMLKALLEKKCRIVKRSMLELVFGEEKHYALNEIAIQRDYDRAIGATGQTQILKLKVDGKEGSDVIAGDGLLFCTPTGSTAYSLSAGGAILTPEVPVIMMTPICAFSMRARPIVFSDAEEFTITNVKGSGVVLADGKVIGCLGTNEKLVIRKAPFTASFPVKEDSDFFAKVRKKLND